MSTVKLGDRCRDTVIGFEGIAVSRHVYYGEIERFELQPPIGDDKKVPDTVTFDAEQIAVTEAGVVQSYPIDESSNIRLGDTVRDITSNFEGCVTGRHEYLNGCVQFTVQPQATSKGKLPDSKFISGKRLDVTNEPAFQRIFKPTGGPMDDPKRVGAPKR